MAEAARNIQIHAGYDEEFLHEVEDDYLCLICQLPLREPVQTRCGHRFCDACLEEHLRRQGVQEQPFTCPADRRVLDRDRDVFPDNATGRKILSLMIKCPSEGCLWTGELRDKEGHMETCRKFPLPCPNSCGDTIPREKEDPTENQQPGNEGGGGGPEGTAWGWGDLALVAAVGTAAVAAAPVVLKAAGGIAAGSIAASAQSVFFGSSVASGSVHAALQRVVSAGIGITASTVIARTTGTTEVFLRPIGEMLWSSGGN